MISNLETKLIKDKLKESACKWRYLIKYNFRALSY